MTKQPQRRQTPPTQWRRAKKKRRSPLGRALAVVGLAVVAGATGFFWKFKNDIGGTIPPPWIVANPRGQFPGKDRLNILLIGKDYSYIWAKGSAASGMPYTKESRADTILMVSLDLEKGKATALSVPRDSLVRAPDGKMGNINATYKRGGEKLLVSTVTDLLGVAPDYVVTVKDDAVKNIVNAVGGIDVETIDEMHRDDAAANLHIHLPKGKQRLNGEEAIGFVRYREPTNVLWKEGKPVFFAGSNTPVPLPRSEIRRSKEDGDFRRMKRQQDLIRAVVTEAKKPGNLFHIGSIASTCLKQFETDLDLNKILALATLYRDVKSDGIQARALQGKDGTIPGTRKYALILDKDKTRHLSDWLLKGNESASNRLTVVAVKNGTKVPGAAKQAATMLRTEGGYEADLAKDAPDTRTENEASATRIIYSTASMEAHAQEIVKLLGGGQLVKDSAPDTTGVLDKSAQRPDITVVLGRDLADNLARRTAIQ